MSKKVARSGYRLSKMVYYCYLRWQRSTTRESNLYWMNMHTRIDDMLKREV